MGNAVLAAFVVVLLAVCAGLAFGVKVYVKPISEIDRALAELQATPLVGLAMKDNPEAAGVIRAAMEDDLRKPVAPGVPTRAFYAVGELSRDHIRPMLSAADDGVVIAVMTARYALVRHMRGVAPDKCRDFAMSTIQRIDSFDPESQGLFSTYLAAMETAYRNGRAAGGKPRPMPTAAEMVTMLGLTGFTQDDLNALNRFASLSAEQACDIEVKIDGALSRLPPEQRAPFSRFVLTH